jgi:RNA 2',3'-cyclic 3'-phosphodiesterase
VALELPPDVAEALVLWGRAAASEPGSGAQRLRVLEPGLLHLTLSFLGSRPVSEIAELESALEHVDGEAGELALGAPVWLPVRRPRALTVEVEDQSGVLASLQGDVSRATGAVTGEPARHTHFRPHVTVIRAAAGPARAGELPATPSLSFVAEQMALVRSHLEPAGARYEALARYPLARSR